MSEREPDLAEGREPRGSARGSRLHPPHVTDNFEDAPVANETPGPDRVEGLPANASGHGEVSADEAAQPIDPESAYDRRPEEDKERPPSTQDG